MTRYAFRGNYREGNLTGGAIPLGKRLSSILEKHGISKLYLVKAMAEDKFPYIQAFPKRPEDKESFPVEVKKGKIKIPKDLIKHAGLDSGRYCITGFPDPPSLKIWNILR